MVWLMLACWRLYRFGKLLRYAQPATPSQQEQVRRLAGQLGLRRCPSVWFMPATVSPMLCALIGAPRLFVPAVLWDSLSDEQRDTLLIHELAHLRRRDHWVRQLEFVATALYWWHPILWWARREIQEAEEQCCDAWVVSLAPAAIPAYAETLVATVAFLSRARPALPLGASGMGHARLLRRRLTMIVRGTTPTGLSAAGFAAVVVLGAVALAVLPAWTQPTAPQVQDEILRGNTIAENAQQQEPDVGAEPLGWRIRHTCMWIRASEAEKNLKELLGVAPAGPPMGDLRNPGMSVANPGNPEGAAGAQGQKVQVISDGATNQVFVIGPLNKLAQARRALAEMDVEQKVQPPQETLTVKTYYAANAEALAKAIKELYGKSSSVAVSAIGKNQIMVSALPTDHAAIRKFIESSKYELVTEQITLNTLTPKDTMHTLNVLFGGIRGAPVLTLADNPKENAIVVRGTPEQIKAVREALKKLDADSTAPANGEQRMKRLEDKLDTLLREVEALRKERRTESPGDRRQRY
jgi:hypothetical protein